MVTRKKITIHDTVFDVALKMAEGNPGAVTVITQILQDKEMGLFRLLDLDDMNIRGSQIWVGYKDYCDEDLPSFVDAIKKRDSEMVNVINRTFGPEWPRAVTHRGSYGS